MKAVSTLRAGPPEPGGASAQEATASAASSAAASRGLDMRFIGGSPVCSCSGRTLAATLEHRQRRARDQLRDFPVPSWNNSDGISLERNRRYKRPRETPSLRAAREMLPPQAASVLS